MVTIEDASLFFSVNVISLAEAENENRTSKKEKRNFINA